MEIYVYSLWKIPATFHLYQLLGGFLKASNCQCMKKSLYHNTNISVIYSAPITEWTQTTGALQKSHGCVCIFIACDHLCQELQLSNCYYCFTAIIHCVPKKVSPLNILQQTPQTCTDLNEILHTQDDIYFCHRRQIS